MKDPTRDSFPHFLTQSTEAKNISTQAALNEKIQKFALKKKKEYLATVLFHIIVYNLVNLSKNYDLNNFLHFMITKDIYA